MRGIFPLQRLRVGKYSGSFLKGDTVFLQVDTSLAGVQENTLLYIH